MTDFLLGDDWIFDQRFWDKVLIGDDCWEWQGGLDDKGYGRFHWTGHYGYAHRRSWELTAGPIPDSLWVLHRCDNPPCVNPAHLFLGTRADNMRDCSEKGRFRNQTKTHCPQGHPYDDANMRRYRGWRVCRACGRDSTHRYRERQKAARVA